MRKTTERLKERHIMKERDKKDGQEERENDIYKTWQTKQTDKER